jgi:hypothetical protein
MHAKQVADCNTTPNCTRCCADLWVVLDDIAGLQVLVLVVDVLTSEVVLNHLQGK